MKLISHWIEAFSSFVWSFPALLGILGTGLAYSLRTGFFQLRRLPLALKTAVQGMRRSPASGVSPFQAVCTALAATVGTGNIAGVAGAIAIGGPGAVFWMWIAAILGMILKYAEVVLAVRYRKVQADGTVLAGPMYYIQDGLPSRLSFLAPTYCLFGVIAAFGVGNATQVSTAVTALDQALPFLGFAPTALTGLAFGIAMGVLVWLVVAGGARRIGSVAELLIPLVCIGYIVLSLGAILHNRAALPQAFGSIFLGAFRPEAFTGGLVGSVFITLRTGVSRGVFTNEAGMGTASVAHGCAAVQHPARQGLLGLFEVFVDTLVICTMTALVILTAPISIPYGTPAGAELTVAAFASVYGSWVTVPLALFMILLAFATILGWGLYGMRFGEFLWGKGVRKSFPLLHAATTALGAVISPAVVWSLAEAVNGLMAVPALLALVLLMPEVIQLTKNYYSS